MVLADDGEIASVCVFGHLYEYFADPYLPLGARGPRLKKGGAPRAFQDHMCCEAARALPAATRYRFIFKKRYRAAEWREWREPPVEGLVVETSASDDVGRRGKLRRLPRETLDQHAASSAWAGVWAAFFLAMAPRRSRLRTILTQLRPSDAGGQPCKRFYDGESREREREREREKEREREREREREAGGRAGRREGRECVSPVAVTRASVLAGRAAGDGQLPPRDRRSLSWRGDALG